MNALYSSSDRLHIWALITSEHLRIIPGNLQRYSMIEIGKKLLTKPFWNQSLTAYLWEDTVANNKGKYIIYFPLSREVGNWKE